MKLFKLPTISWVSLLISIFAIPLAYAAPLIGSQKCQLGETCRLGSSMSYTYYPVTPNTGTNYSCTIKAADNSNINVSILSYRDFNFKSKEVSIDNNGVTVTLSGRFTGSSGAIKIRQTTGFTPKGTVNCKAGM
jgi:hypothetical protein